MNRDLGLALFLLVVVAGAGWWLYSQSETAAVDNPTTVPPAVTETHREPAYLVPTLSDPQNLVDLPHLDDSDGYFQLELRNLFGSALDRLLMETGGVERFVATIDNLPGETIAESVRSVRPVAGSFIVEDNTISPTNADRYDLYVALFTQSDTGELVSAYQRFYPLMQQAYERLGYPDAYFNDRVIEVIDHLLETPDYLQPLAVTRPNVLFEYADPELEALSSGQKILLRLGPDHASAVKGRLSELRNRLTSFNR